MQSTRQISVFVLGQEHCLNNPNVHELLLTIWLTHKALLEDYKEMHHKKNQLCKEKREVYESHIYPLEAIRKDLQLERKKIKKNHKKTKKEKKFVKEIKEKIAAITKQITSKKELYKNNYTKFKVEFESERKRIVNKIEKTINSHVFFEEQAKSYNVPILYNAKFFRTTIELLDKVSPHLMIGVVNKSHYLLIQKIKEIILTNDPDKIGLAIDSSLDLSNDLLNSAKGFTSSYLNLYMVRDALSKALQREIVIIKFTLADIENEETEFCLDKALRFYGFDPKAQNDQSLRAALLKARSERRDIRAAASYLEHSKAIGVLRENEHVNFFLNRYPNTLKYGNASFLKHSLFKNKPGSLEKYTEEVKQYRNHLLIINSIDDLLQMAKDESCIVNMYALIHHLILQKNDYFSLPESHIINDEFTFHLINDSKDTIEKVFSTFYKHNPLLPAAIKLFIYYYNGPEFIERGVINGHPTVQANQVYKQTVKNMIETSQKLANNSIFDSSACIQFELHHPPLSNAAKRNSRDRIVGRWSSQEVKTRLSTSSGSPSTIRANLSK